MLTMSIKFEMDYRSINKQDQLLTILPHSMLDYLSAVMLQKLKHWTNVCRHKAHNMGLDPHT